MNGTVAVVRLLLRRNRFRLAAWTLPLLFLVAVTIPGYAATYPSLASRGPLVHQLQATPATKVLYGPLPSPGTLGQLAQWETGTYVLLLVSVMAVLLTVAVSRRDEDRGLTELVTASGIGRWAQLSAAGLLLTSVFVVLGASIAVILSAESIGHPGDLTVSGAVCFGAVVSAVGIGISAQTMLVAEVLWDSRSASRAAWALIGIGFGARVAADFTSMTWMRWGTWFGLRDLVRPYSDDRLLPLAVASSAAVAIGTLAAIGHARRELGSGLIAPPRGGTRSIQVHSVAGLTWRLDRGSLMAWALPTVAVSALFGGMSHGLIGLVRDDAGTAGLMQKITTTLDPVQQYFSFSYVFAAALPTVYAVVTVLRALAEERAGLIDAELTTGVAHWRPLAARAAQAAAGSLGLLLLGSSTQAATALATAQDAPVREVVTWAFWAPLTQAPGVIAVTGMAALAVGLAARPLTGLVWAAVAWSGFIVLLGGIARLPQFMRRFALLGHLPAAPPAMTASAILLSAIGVSTAVLGCVTMRSRDLTPD